MTCSSSEKISMMGLKSRDFFSKRRLPTPACLEMGRDVEHKSCQTSNTHNLTEGHSHFVKTEKVVESANKPEEQLNVRDWCCSQSRYICDD
jgi:hypothetical protein